MIKALDKNRDRRYETAAGLAADIRRYLTDEPVAAGRPAAYRIRKFIKRNRASVTAAATLLIVLLGGVLGTTWGLGRAIKAERVAIEERNAKEAVRLHAVANEAQVKRQSELARAGCEQARSAGDHGVFGDSGPSLKLFSMGVAILCVR